jgi:hypothetical protein
MALVFTALVGPWVIARISQVSDDRAKAVDLAINLDNQISDSLTSTVELADLFAGGFPPKPGDMAPAGQSGTVYTAAYERWVIDESKLGSQIATYFGICPQRRLPEQLDPGSESAAPIYRSNQELRCGWTQLFPAVTDLLELSASSAQPAGTGFISDNPPNFYLTNLMNDLRFRVNYWPSGVRPTPVALNVDYQTAPPGQEGGPFGQAFGPIAEDVLLERDRLMSDVQNGQPKGFLLHFFDDFPVEGWYAIGIAAALVVFLAGISKAVPEKRDLPDRRAAPTPGTPGGGVAGVMEPFEPTPPKRGLNVPDQLGADD